MISAIQKPYRSPVAGGFSVYLKGCFVSGTDFSGSRTLYTGIMPRSGKMKRVKYAALTPGLASILPHDDAAYNNLLFANPTPSGGYWTLTKDGPYTYSSLGGLFTDFSEGDEFGVGFTTFGITFFARFDFE